MTSLKRLLFWLLSIIFRCSKWLYSLKYSHPFRPVTPSAWQRNIWPIFRLWISFFNSNVIFSLLVFPHIPSHPSPFRHSWNKAPLRLVFSFVRYSYLFFFTGLGYRTCFNCLWRMPQMFSCWRCRRNILFFLRNRYQPPNCLLVIQAVSKLLLDR